MSQKQGSGFFEVLQTAKKYPLLVLIALVLCIFLEFWFYNYPPRGVVTEDTLILGSVLGSPLVKFDALWTRIINDDGLMLQLVDESGLATKPDPRARLALASSVRKNLRYTVVNETVIKISLVRPGYDGRGVLNRFSSFVLTRLKELGDENLASQRELVKFKLHTVVERAWVIAAIFRLPGFQELLADKNAFARLYSQSLSAVDNPTIWNKLGWLWLNDQLAIFYAAQNLYRQHFADDLRLLSLFPRSPCLISSPDAPSVPVQPFHQLIFLLMPCAVGLMYFALLIALRQRDAVVVKQ